MEFGKLPDVDQIDFGLPPETEVTRERLGRFANDARPIVRLGAARWVDPGFVGKIYPPGTRGLKALQRYVEQFDCIELNATFYGVDRDRIRIWTQQAPESFRFAPKVPRSITHDRRLRDVAGLVDDWIEALQGFGDRLGHTWLLLPEDFAAHDGGFDRLRDVLERLVERVPTAVELRDPSWFGPARSAVFSMCHDLGVSTILTDVAGRRDVAHMEPTTDTFLLRFVGNRLHHTDRPRLDAWVERLAHWFELGLREVQIWLHQPEDHLVVELAEHIGPKLARKLDIDLRIPQRVSVPKQLDLFG